MHVPETKHNLYVDYARFMSEEPGHVRLELYYQVFNSGLEFKKEADQWVAQYQVSAVVKGKKGKQVATFDREKQITVPNEQKTKSSFDYRTGQINFDLPPGKYTVVFTLRSASNRKVETRELKVKLKTFYTATPSFSDVEFVQAVQELSDSAGSFTKGDLQIVPSVSRIFGGDEDNRLLSYIEIYRGSDSTGRVVVETRLRHATKGLVYRDTLHTELTLPVVRQLREISLKDFPSGSYEMYVYLRGRRNKQLVKQTKQFEVLWSQEALLKHDWGTALGQLAYIAEPGEISEMKKLSSVKERKQAFDEFWRRRDPTIGSVENEAKGEFYRRVYIANQRFSVLRRQGWRADRGRIYIRHGEPDELDDFPYPLDSHPYQVWHYYVQGRYRRFTFVDEKSDGDYRLQYPFDGLHQTPDF